MLASTKYQATMLHSETMNTQIDRHGRDNEKGITFQQIEYESKDNRRNPRKCQETKPDE